MQLSASTTPTDPSLAALLVAAGRNLSSETVPGATGLTPNDGLPVAFSDLLSDAGAMPTAIPASDSGATVAVPTAAATIANFPSWLTADAPVPVNTPQAPLADGDITAELPAPSGPTGTLVASGKNGRPAKAPKVSLPTDTQSSVRRGPALATESTAVPAVATANVMVAVTGAGEPTLPVPTGETDAEQNPDLQEEGENLPTAIAAIPSRKQGKSSDSQQPQIPVDDEEASSTGSASGRPASAPTSEFSGSDEAFPELPQPSVPPANADVTSASTVTLPPTAAFNSMPPAAFHRASIPSRFAPADVSAPAQDFEPMVLSDISSFAPTPAIRPVQELVRAVAGESASDPSAPTSRETLTLPSFATSVTTPQSSDARAQSPDATPRTIRFENSVPTREEIFAALDGKILTAQNPAVGGSDKTFLSTSPKRVTSAPSTVGTDVAKSETVMSTATLSHRPSFVAPLERAQEVTFAPAPVSSPEATTAEPTIVAHRAVDAVMTAVERFSVGDRHSVQLQFSVGGADLSVRVELRGDEVRTTFRTDSPELRNALAHEWATAAASSASDSSDRAVRIATPVFSASNNSAFSSDTGSRQHDARGRRTEAEDIFSAVASRSRSTPAFAPTADHSGAPAARAAVSGTALHLSTHA